MDDQSRVDIDVDELRSRLSIYEAISTAMDRWPEVSAAAASAESREEAATLLGALLDINEQQADAVMSINVSSLAKRRRAGIEDEIYSLRAQLSDRERETGR
jgi:DNA gyrase/topoisomerase IV subunit A